MVFDTTIGDKMKIVGVKHEKLTCVQQIGYRLETPRPNTKYKRVFYLFDCDCGGKYIGSGKDVINGKITSCGCVALAASKKLGEANKKGPSDYPAFKHYYNSYKTRAKRREKEFYLTEEEFKEITSSNCHYCNQPPSQGYSLGFGSPATPYTCNGIDRKNSGVGYIYSNCLPACIMCNRAKNSENYDYFIEWLDKVADYRNKVNAELIEIN